MRLERVFGCWAIVAGGAERGDESVGIRVDGLGRGRLRAEVAAAAGIVLVAAHREHALRSPVHLEAQAAARLADRAGAMDDGRAENRIQGNPGAHRSLRRAPTSIRGSAPGPTSRSGVSWRV